MEDKETKLFDMHCHLQDEVFCDDLEDVLFRAEDAGVGWLVCNGTSQKDWPRVDVLSGRFESIIPFFGLHPWFTESAKLNWQRDLKARLISSNSGVGETGLDKSKRYKNLMDRQIEVFVCQIKIANELSRPLSVHCVHAWQELIETFKKEVCPAEGFMVHGFNGSEEIMTTLAELGGYFSFSGYAAKENFKKMRNALQNCPEDRILLETDSPYMPVPENFRVVSTRRVRNEPANLAGFLPVFSELRGLEPNALARQVQENCMRFLQPIYRQGR